MAVGSPLILSLGTVFLLVGICVTIIAGITENWYEFAVNRSEVLPLLKRDVKSDDVTYYSRNYGLALVCFPAEVPPVNTFSFLGQNCIWNPQINVSQADFQRYTDVQVQHLFFMRATPIAYLSGIICALLGLVPFLVGCWKRSASFTNFTAFMMFGACLCLACALVLFHVVQYQEHHLMKMHPYYQSFDHNIRNKFVFAYGWSYVLAWIGLLFLLLSTVVLFIAAKQMRNSKDGIYRAKSEAFYGQHYDKTIAYPGAYNPYEMYSNYYGYPTMQAPSYYGHNAYVYGTHPQLN